MSAFTFDAEVWEHDGDAAWHFVSVPPAIADDIAELAGPQRRGFGSVRVEARIGTTTWQTSVFPDTRRRTYVLPVKRAVRTAEAIESGTTVHVRLRLL